MGEFGDGIGRPGHQLGLAREIVVPAHDVDIADARAARGHPRIAGAREGRLIAGVGQLQFGTAGARKVGRSIGL